MVHIDDLLEAVSNFQNEVRRAIMSGQIDETKFEGERRKLMSWCKTNGLEIDFTIR